MSVDGKYLSPDDYRLLSMVDELRKRAVLTARIPWGDSYLELALSPELAPQNTLTEVQRQLLLNNPETPEQMKVKLREEYENDLYASA